MGLWILYLVRADLILGGTLDPNVARGSSATVVFGGVCKSVCFGCISPFQYRHAETYLSEAAARKTHYRWDDDQEQESKLFRGVIDIPWLRLIGHALAAGRDFVAFRGHHLVPQYAAER